MKAWKDWTTKGRFRVVLAASIILCAGGVAVAALVTKNAQDGGRGGAAAVALSFVILFLSRGYGTKIYEALTKEAATIRANLDALLGNGKNQPAIRIEDKVNALVSKAKIESQTQEIQNFYLAWSSVFGTLTWGFGDIVAKAGIFLVG